MDLLYFILERYISVIVLFIVFLVVVFAVVRPALRLLVEVQHRRKLEEIKQERAALSEKAVERELEEMLQQASVMGMKDQQHIRRLAQSDPEQARDQVRSWIHGEAKAEDQQRRGTAKESV